MTTPASTPPSTLSRWLAGAWLWMILAALLAARPLIHLKLFPDTRDYIELAAHLAAGDGFVTNVVDRDTMALPDPRLHHPPVYSLLVAACLKLGLSMPAALKAVAILSFLVAAFLAGRIGRHLGGAAGASLAIPAFLLVAALTEGWNHAMSEAPFVALVAAFFVVMIPAAGQEKAASWRLFLGGVLAGLAMLTRFMGATLIIGLGVFFFWEIIRRRERRVLLSRAGAFLLCLAGWAVAALPWFVHYYLLTHRVTGRVTAASIVPFYRNLVGLVRSPLLDLAPVIAFVLAIILLARPARRALNAALGRIAPGFSLCLVWVICYFSVLLGMAAVAYVDPIGTRLTHPAYVVLAPLLVAFALLWWEADRSSAPELSTGGLSLLALLLVAIVVFQAGNAFRTLGEDPPVYDNDLTRWVSANTPAGSLILNPAHLPILVPPATGRYIYVRSFVTDYDVEGLRGFLGRFAPRLTAVYLLTPAEIPSDVIASYLEIGLRPEPVPSGTGFRAYRMLGEKP